MEVKDLLPILIGALGIMVAIAGTIIAVWQFRKNQKLQLELKQYQQTKDADELAEKFDDIAQEENRIKSDAETYSEHIHLKFKHLDFTGLNAILQKPLMLENVYVKLRAKPSYSLDHYRSIDDFNQLSDELKEKKKSTGKKTPEPDRDFVEVFEELHRQCTAAREPLKAVILGQPGSGKTTLMKWIALQCAINTKENVFKNFTPVFISLKDFGRDPVNTFRKHKNILNLTIDKLECGCNPHSFIKDQFESNHILFLLDGLDEVADERIRKEVITWIQDQNIRKNALLITSRFSGLHHKTGLTFHNVIPVFNIQDFDIADIERFLENWCQNVEIALLGYEDQNEKEQAIKKGTERFEALMKIIKSDNYKSLRQLAINPLLLTVIALVHRKKDTLPKERHRLYYDALEIMIKLWNEGTGRHEVLFSTDNSMDNLSVLAVALMKGNRRELELPEIKSLLKAEIEGHPLDFFLKEMVLKAGLLYESDGKYGFLHLTFQEYLAAWYFSRCENQNQILEYWDKDYWTETFKLFVNIGNAHHLFNQVIEHLEAKEYWRNMNLWDDCLRDIVAEEQRNTIEIKFAKGVLEILPKIPYEEAQEEKIIQLHAHYPIYQYAEQFKQQGWELFHKAQHPFVQSVGSSILNKAGQETQAEMMTEIINRVKTFDTKKKMGRTQLTDFLYQNNNSFVLLIAARKKLSDFNVALATLKSDNFFLVYLDLLDLLYLLYLLDLRDLRYLRYLLDLRDLRDLRDLLYLRDLRDLLYLRDLRDLRDLLYLRDLLDLRDLRDLRYLRYLRYLRDLRDRFIEKYDAILKEHRQAIHDWVDKALAKLHGLSDKELMKYFPGSTAAELREFRLDEPGDD